MTGEQFEACLTALGWTHRWLADYFTARGFPVSRKTVDRWADGTTPVPPDFGEWLELRVRNASLHALPAGWRK